MKSVLVDQRVAELVRDEKAERRRVADEKRAKIRVQAGADVRREEARRAQAEAKAKMDAADVEINASGPVLILKYRGLTITCTPEVAAADMVARLPVFQAFKDIHGLSLNDHERCRYVARRLAVGKPIDTPLKSVEFLVRQFSDVARGSIKRGLITITQENSQ